MFSSLFSSSAFLDHSQVNTHLSPLEQQIASKLVQYIFDCSDFPSKELGLVQSEVFVFYQTFTMLSVEYFF